MNSETTNTAATVAEHGATVTPERAGSKKEASQKKAASKGHKTAQDGKPNAVPRKVKAGKKSSTKTAGAKQASRPRAESKGAKILELIGRSQGATLVEIRKATGWQAHSVRGFLSTAAKKHGLKIASSKNENGERSYAIGK